MPKTQTRFVCQNCGRQSPRYMGRCPSCGEYNTMVEEVLEAAKPSKQDRRATSAVRAAPQRLTEVSNDVGQRLFVPVEEFNRVLGGGIVPGSILLIGGEPGIGKCITGDTQVLDPESGAYLPITEWANKSHQVLSVDPEKLQLAPSAVSAFCENGLQPIVELTTDLGRTLRCTVTHPVLTPNGWKSVGELKVGDYIASPRALPYFGQDSLPEAQVKLIAYILSDGSAQTSINVTNLLPEVADDLETIAEYYGMRLVAYNKAKTQAKQYRFVKHKPQHQEARQEIANALYAAKVKMEISWAEWSRRANVSYGMLHQWRAGHRSPREEELQRLADAIGIPLRELEPVSRYRTEVKTPIMHILEQVGLRSVKANNKFIPNCIFTLPREQLALFLKTIFTCDGSVFVSGHNEPGVSYSTISRRLAEDLQHLLLRFGLIFKLRTKRSRVNDKPYIAYELTLHGIQETRKFLNSIGIMGRDEARAKIAEMETPSSPSTHRDTVPTGEAFWEHLYEICGKNFADISRQIGTTIKDRRHERPISRYLMQKIATAYPDPRFQALGYGDIYWDEVASISPCGEEVVYDLSVPARHNFVANDLIVHNSTLMIQICNTLAEEVGVVLYVSGEESARQIKMRADRLGLKSEDLYLLTETNLSSIFEHVYQLNPTILIIDSIQTTYTEESESSPGSVTQVRECASRLQALAKNTGLSVFLVGHVTKDGSIAGPRVLEHIVDTVLYLEGDPFQAFRLLRSVKNRFGATSEVGVFEMSGAGMVEVANPSEAFLAERSVNAPGTAIAITMEGTRPLLVEMQALTGPTTFGNPRRTPNGVDINRLLLVSAVLTRRLGMRLHEQDIFVNVVGGLRVDEPASDLAMAIAIASSYFDKMVPADLAVVGEVGLTGELRSVGQLSARLNEAAKLGFKRVLMPKLRRKVEDIPPGLKLVEVRNVGEALAVAVPKE